MRFQARKAGPVKYSSISDWFRPKDRYTWSERGEEHKERRQLLKADGQIQLKPFAAPSCSSQRLLKGRCCPAEHSARSAPQGAFGLDVPNAGNASPWPIPASAAPARPTQQIYLATLTRDGWAAGQLLPHIKGLGRSPDGSPPHRATCSVLSTEQYI